MKSAAAKPAWLKTNSMLFTILGAVLLLVLVSLFPMSTSLAQGINEGIITGFEGVYDPGNQIYNLRFLYQDGTYVDLPMTALPVSDYSNHSQKSMWTTPMDFVPALKAGYEKSPN